MTSNALFLPNARVRWVDDNGMLTPVAIRALEQIFQRTGGSEGVIGDSSMAGVSILDALPLNVSTTNDQSQDGPISPLLTVIDQTQDAPPSLLTQFPDIPDDLTTRISQLEARLNAAELLIAELREGTIT